MISKKFCNISIEGLACAVPSKVVLSQELTELFDANSVNRFVAATGIKQRHVTNGKQTGSDLCYVAAKKLMEEKSLSGDEIDALVFLNLKSRKLTLKNDKTGDESKLDFDGFPYLLLWTKQHLFQKVYLNM